MATYRDIQVSFWTDSKIVDDFSPEDKLFYLYLMTNPHTSICGCYEISTKQMMIEVGFSEEKCRRLLERFEKELDIIRYDDSTKEVLLLNWYKYNWSTSENVRKGIYTGILHIKNNSFKAYLTEIYEGNDTVDIPSTEGLQTVDRQSTETMSTSVIGSRRSVVGSRKSVNGSRLNISQSDVESIINHLNERCNTHYRATSAETLKYIQARMRDKFTVADFYTVIDKMAEKWLGDPKMQDYLRPRTLFGTKFESYLNAPRGKPSKSDAGNDFLRAVIGGKA